MKTETEKFINDIVNKGGQGSNLSVLALSTSIGDLVIVRTSENNIYAKFFDGNTPFNVDIASIKLHHPEILKRL